MMLEIVFVDNETGRVNYAISQVDRIRYIAPSGEIGFDANGRSCSSSFMHTEKIEVHHAR